MDKKKHNEDEMGSGDSDDEFYNVKLPYTPTSDKSVKKIEVKKVYSPPRTKVQYDYKFESSSDEESENKHAQKNRRDDGISKSEPDKLTEKKESIKENTNLSQNTSKVVEKINEELKNMKNTGGKPNSEKTENMLNQNHVATSMSANATVSQHQLGVVPPVMVVPSTMVVPQASVMGPMIVPSPLGLGSQNIMTMMSPQNMMGMAGNMLRAPNPMGGLMTTTGSGLVGMNAVPSMMGMQVGLPGSGLTGQSNMMGLQANMITSAAMGGINMAMQGNMMRMASAGNSMLRMQGPGSNIIGIQGANNMMGITRPGGSMIGVPRPIGIPGPTGNVMVNASSVMQNPGGLMVMGSMIGSPNVVAATASNTSGNNLVRVPNSPQGNIPTARVAPPPFIRGKSSPPVNFKWQTNQKTQANLPKTGSPTTSKPGSSPSIPSPASSPVESKDYDGEDVFKDDRDNSSDKSPNLDTDESQSPPREVPNTFKNDGSFMEMFKKMREESNLEAKSNENSGEKTDTSNSSSLAKKPTVMLSGIVGKRRGGRVLKTGLVKKVKKGSDQDDEKHPKDAWSMYMAEVKKYREASCEEEGKTRPLDLTEEVMSKVEGLSTVPYDPRFPNTNQSRNCFQNYVDYQKCVKKRGEDFEACQYFKRASRVLCPNAWIEKWDGQVEEGTFPVKL